MDSSRVIDFANQQVHWLDDSIPFKSTNHYADPSTAFYSLSYADADADSYAITIMESKYDQVGTDEVANQQTHLTPQQRTDLAQVLSNFSKLFSGKLGLYPTDRSTLN
jgi:hypothetical protein